MNLYEWKISKELKAREEVKTLLSLGEDVTSVLLSEEQIQEIKDEIEIETYCENVEFEGEIDLTEAYLDMDGDADCECPDDADGCECPQMYFDFLPGFLSNAGIQANYTFVTGQDDEALASPQSLPLATTPGNGLEGFTPHSYNIVGFYEDDSFSARVSWNWRDQFLVKRTGLAGIAEHFDAYGQLDLGFGYALSENTKITLDVSNLLDENTIKFADVRERVILNEYTGRRFLLGVRSTF